MRLADLREMLALLIVRRKCTEGELLSILVMDFPLLEFLHSLTSSAVVALLYG
jgi:hypothetical protein